MGKCQVTLERREDARILFGLWGRCNDRSMPKDVDELSGRFNRAVRKGREPVLPLAVLTRSFDKGTLESELFIGSDKMGEGLSALAVPPGLYGKITVRPKLGFLWGPAIGRAKRYFYTAWLPESGYEAVNLEYEYHTEKSVGGAPEIDLYFAIREAAPERNR